MVYKQIVVPPRQRAEILKLVHSLPMSGHLVVNKTQDRILQHFYWPKWCKSVAVFMKTCHWSQMVGKPNQNAKPVPLKAAPASDDPFSKIVIQYVDWMPKAKSGNSYLLTITCSSTRVRSHSFDENIIPSRLWPNVPLNLVCPKKFNLSKVPISHLGSFNK